MNDGEGQGPGDGLPPAEGDTPPAPPKQPDPIEERVRGLEERERQRLKEAEDYQQRRGDWPPWAPR